ncbi:acryloyl-CoA reductase [Saccharibacillus sp. CPCC 101409]|uniref:acrylyl-CoA reductase family protein n=1 Tax=Saccharibacillus sp. CPCC 101409 TaxID=3058041 RepID=UPI002672EFC0|nr:acryloyl-CoA reductase [Saccharibacillus sp. CPCC 101409]MDO3410620.1 acryloyl-CoA reductase [Saccharibacillus sp. CPCC 101409]
MSEQFRAFWLEENDGKVSGSVKQIGTEDLPQGEVLVRVHYSDVNYKDGLASVKESRIVREYPFIPGIDLAGEVVASDDERFAAGDGVLCTGYGLGVSHFGGYSELARVPADWLIKLPESLTAREAMIIGTAGFTAGMSVEAILGAGVTPADGPVLVTGATGGVGSVAVAILAKLGFEVTASSGKEREWELLKKLGAAHTISREEAQAPSKGPLGKGLWSAIVDPVGGAGTGERLKAIRYRGVLALSGLTGGGDFGTSVHPFILRGVTLAGIDSVQCPLPLRLEIWNKLASDWKPDAVFEQAVSELGLEQLPDALSRILEGRAVGRQLVRVGR